MTDAGLSTISEYEPVNPDRALFAQIEKRLDGILPAASEFPDVLHKAMRHATLGGGKRLRSRLTLLVATAVGSGPLSAAEQALALDAACAIELLHAGSLVHDDMPCFDNAPLRRGLQTVHVAFGEPLAMLTGDALLSLAFEVISNCDPSVLPRAMRILYVLARSVGSCEGIIGGQSLELHWNRYFPNDAGIPEESETRRQSLAVSRYHYLKTGALFRAAAEVGAIVASGAEAQRWGELGQSIGRFFQLTDDLYDISKSAEPRGKPVQQDLVNARPNAAMIASPQYVVEELGRLLEKLKRDVKAIAANPAPLLRFLGELHTYIKV